MAPRPLVNTTIVCNTTLGTYAEALDKVLGALLGIVFLLFVCSPLIFNLPKDKDDNRKTTRQARPPPPGITRTDDGIEMRDFADGREIPSPEQFVIGDDESPDATVIEDESPNTTQSTLPDPQQFREVIVDGELFHVNKSQASMLASTGVFRGAGDEHELATRCVDETQSLSTAGESDHEGSEMSQNHRIGTAV